MYVKHKKYVGYKPPVSHKMFVRHGPSVGHRLYAAYKTYVGQQLFMSVFAMSDMMLLTVSLITGTYPLPNSDFAFSILSASVMNNRHQYQSVINFVS
jgi:hypothetical protein